MIASLKKIIFTTHPLLHDFTKINGYFSFYLPLKNVISCKILNMLSEMYFVYINKFIRLLYNNTNCARSQ